MSAPRASDAGRRGTLRMAVATTASVLLDACGLRPGREDDASPSQGDALPPPPAAALAALMPTGVLRAAINLGNPMLAGRDSEGQPAGISVDLARDFAATLGCPLALMTFPSAGQVVTALKDNRVDMAFVAIDPQRGMDVRYTAPYLVIEGAYLVRNDSPILSLDEVDRPGVRVVVGAGSAYDLYLRRTLHQAQLVRAPTSPAVVDFFLAQRLDVAAGVRQQLEADARRVGGVRMLDGRFMEIRQAVGTPRVRGEAGVMYLRAWLQARQREGFIARSMERHHVEGARLG